MLLKLTSATPLDNSYSQAYTAESGLLTILACIELIVTGLEWLSLLSLDKRDACTCKCGSPCHSRLAINRHD